MCLSGFNNTRCVKYFVLLLLVFFCFSAYSACGLIPAGYPLYSSTEIKLTNNISVNGNTVSSGNYSPKAAIAPTGAISTNVSLSLPSLDPAAFPLNNSNTSLEITSSTTFDNNTEVYYKVIKPKSDGITVNFTGGGTVHINDMVIEGNNVTLNFAAGTYYFNNFIANLDNISINISSGPVIFHIGTEFKFDGINATINPTGNVDDLRVYLHSVAKFNSSKSNLNFTGLIYGPANVDSVIIGGSGSSIHGAIMIADGRTELNNNNIAFTYTSADQTAIGQISTCINSIANPMATFYMDESSWNGSLNEVIDSSGNTNHGNAVGSANTTSAGKICRGANIPFNTTDAEQFAVDTGIDIDDQVGNTGTINFWYKSHVNWVGGGERALFDASPDDLTPDDKFFLLMLNNNGELQFAVEDNNASDFIFKTAAQNFIANEWVHIATTWDMSGARKIYINGSLLATDSNVTTGQIGELRTLFLGDNRSHYHFGGTSNSANGVIDEVRIYSQILTATEIQNDMNKTHNCSNPTDTPATAFNCVENGADVITSKLYTKTTTQAFSVDVVALQNASTVETNFASGADHTVNLELVDSTTGDGSCSNYTILNPAVSQNLTFTATDNGIKSSASMSSATAYRSVKCRLTDATDSPSVIGCSTDSFAIRPSSFAITSTLTNATSSGTPTAKAGASFSLTATTASGYDGTPKIDTSKLQAHSGANQVGTLAGVFSQASAGVASGSSFSYAEVGSLRFAAEGIYDDTFTAVDQNSDCTDDFSNTVVAGKVGCKFGNTVTTNYFGRFIPDHFDVVLNTPVFSPACGSFTYLGQPVSYATTPVATLTAKNSAGVTTQNYTADFWKITATGLTPTYSVNTHTLNVLDSSAASVVDSGNGSGTLTFSDTSSNILAVSKDAISAPFDAEISLSFSLLDSDNISVANVNGSAQTNPVLFGATSTGNGMAFSSGSKSQRWGRLVLDNGYGSELNPLSLPVYTEYYNGVAFVKNTADSCTSLSMANNFSISDSLDFNCSFSTQNSPVSVGSSGSVKAALSSGTLISGSDTVVFSDNSDSSAGPGAGNTGYVDLTSNLSNLSWLMFDWDGDTNYDNCPSARASFGLFKGNSRQIYFREVY